MGSPKTLLYQVTDRVARITLNRPERGNGITRLLVSELERCVEQADLDPAVHVILLAGAGKGFCGGYDLVESAEGQGLLGEEGSVPPPGSPLDPAVMAANHDPAGTWDAMVDYAMMSRNVRAFMSLFHCGKPVVCKVQGFCVAGGTDMALCSDLLVIAADAKIGYPPARVWGSPTTSMWIHRLGPQRAKRLLFTGDSLSGAEALEWGLAIEAPELDRLDERTRDLARSYCPSACQSAAHDEAVGQPVALCPGALQHPDFGDLDGRRSTSHRRGLCLPGSRDAGRLPGGGTRARRTLRRSGSLHI